MSLNKEDFNSKLHEIVPKLVVAATTLTAAIYEFSQTLTVITLLVIAFIVSTIIRYIINFLGEIWNSAITTKDSSGHYQPPKEPWYKRPVGIVMLGTLVAVIGGFVKHYFGW